MLPAFEPDHLVLLLENDFPIEINLQILSILSKDIATKPYKTENVEIYTKVLALIGVVLGDSPCDDKYTHRERIDLMFDIISILTLKSAFKAMITTNLLNALLSYSEKPDYVMEVIPVILNLVRDQDYDLSLCHTYESAET